MLAAVNSTYSSEELPLFFSSRKILSSSAFHFSYNIAFIKTTQCLHLKIVGNLKIDRAGFNIIIVLVIVIYVVMRAMSTKHVEPEARVMSLVLIEGLAEI
jgi:hypothetical protein